MADYLVTHPKVSIITPFKNTARFICETAQSIFNQTHTNWEWILVNDHSGENEEQLIHQYLQDTRVKLMQNSGFGIIDALVTAQGIISGDFVTRMDADDIMPENKLEIFVRKLLQSNADLITGKVKYFRNDGNVSSGYLTYENWLNKQVDLQDFYSEIYRECTIASGNWLMTKDVFLKYNGFSELFYPEDYDLLFRWYRCRLKIVGVDTITHFWRDHDWRTSRNSKKYSQKYFFQLKVKRFLELDFNKEPLVINGDGLKGKLVVKELLVQRIPFYWVGKVARIIKNGEQFIEIISPSDLPDLQNPIMLNTTLIDSQQLKDLYGFRLNWRNIIQL
jgi:glycosyltransferase involved in cell wall biosynthesis